MEYLNIIRREKANKQLVEGVADAHGYLDRKTLQ